MSCTGRLVEYRGPSSKYLIRVKNGNGGFVTVASRGTMRQVRSYVERLLGNDVQADDIHVYEAVRWSPGRYL